MHTFTNAQTHTKSHIHTHMYTHIHNTFTQTHKFTHAHTYTSRRISCRKKEGKVERLKSMYQLYWCLLR